MKYIFLIQQNCLHKKDILLIIKKNKFLSSKQVGIVSYNQKNWFKIFSKISFNNIIFVFDNDGYLPFLFFSKQKNVAVSFPINEQEAILSRAHNNSNVCVVQVRNVIIKNIDKLITSYCKTKFESGRHNTRLNIMHKSFTNKAKHLSFNSKCKNTITICSDHAGFELKQKIIKYLANKKYKIIDVGTYSKDSTHYPLYAIAMSKYVNKSFVSISICYTGFGIANTCNKFNGLLACICRYPNDAIIARKKYGSNVLSLGAKYTNFNLASKIVDAFLKNKANNANKKLKNIGFSFSKEKFNLLKINKSLIPNELK